MGLFISGLMVFNALFRMIKYGLEFIIPIVLIWNFIYGKIVLANLWSISPTREINHDQAEEDEITRTMRDFEVKGYFRDGDEIQRRNKVPFHKTTLESSVMKPGSAARVKFWNPENWINSMLELVKCIEEKMSWIDFMIFYFVVCLCIRIRVYLFPLFELIKLDTCRIIE